MRRTLFPYYIIVTILIIIVSCSKEDVSENAARLRIKLTDATSLVLKELHVDIAEQVLRVSGFNWNFQVENTIY